MALDPIVEERILTSLHHREGDRVPIWDCLDNRAIFEHFNPDETDCDQGMVNVYHGLGIDLCRGYGASFSEAQDGETTEDGRVSGRTRWTTEHAVRSLQDLKAYEPGHVTDEELIQWVARVRQLQGAFEP